MIVVVAMIVAFDVLVAVPVLVVSFAVAEFAVGIAIWIVVETVAIVAIVSVAVLVVAFQAPSIAAIVVLVVVEAARHEQLDCWMQPEDRI